MICRSKTNCDCAKSSKNSHSQATYPAVLDLSPTKLLALPAAGATALFNAYPKIKFSIIKIITNPVLQLFYF